MGQHALVLLGRAAPSAHVSPWGTVNTRCRRPTSQPHAAPQSCLRAEPALPLRGLRRCFGFAPGQRLGEEDVGRIFRELVHRVQPEVVGGEEFRVRWGAWFQ